MLVFPYDCISKLDSANVKDFCKTLRISLFLKAIVSPRHGYYSIAKGVERSVKSISGYDGFHMAPLT